jgi:hypothetical protein
MIETITFERLCSATLCCGVVWYGGLCCCDGCVAKFPVDAQSITSHRPTMRHIAPHHNAPHRTTKHHIAPLHNAPPRTTAHYNAPALHHTTPHHTTVTSRQSDDAVLWNVCCNVCAMCSSKSLRNWCKLLCDCRQSLQYHLAITLLSARLQKSL